MLKQLVHSGKFRLSHVVDPGPLTIVIVGVLGLGFLVAEGVVLSAQGIQGIAVALIAVFVAMVATPALRTAAAAADQPLILRCSLETAPSHTRNAIIRDFLARIETAAAGRSKTQLFESGQLFPDLQVGKAPLHPPVGLNLFLLSSIAVAPMGEAIRGILPFLMILLIVLAIITYVPVLTLCLPGAIFGQ
jgi:tripartite ATP-independent transporter DctM subunit